MPCASLSTLPSINASTNTATFNHDHSLPLLSVSKDAKTIKGEQIGFLTGILYLSPLSLAGGPNLCPFASPECAQACLNTAGRGAMGNVQRGRLRKTRFFLKDKSGFLARLTKDIRKLVTDAQKAGLKPVVRLNGTSDISWENVYPQIFTQFPNVQFYDYTKSAKRVYRFLNGKLGETDWSKNYHLTFSRSETNDHLAKALLIRGGNVAMVFSRDLHKSLFPSKDSNASNSVKSSLPIYGDITGGFTLINGDANDLRFLDDATKPAPKNYAMPSNSGFYTTNHGQIVALKAKGKAKKMEGNRHADSLEALNPAISRKSFVVNHLGQLS